MKKVNRYSDEFKSKVVQEVLQGEITKEACRLKYGIKGKSLILKWMRKFGVEKEIFIVPTKDPSIELRHLKGQVQFLKKELAYEKLKSESLCEMLQIAEDQYKIPIRKKSGAKQSKR